MYFIPKKFRNFSPGRHNFSLRQTITIIMSLSLPFIVAACGSLPTPYEVEASRNRVMKFVNSRGEAISRLNQLLRRQPMTPDSETKLRNVCRGCYYKVKSVNQEGILIEAYTVHYSAYKGNYNVSHGSKNIRFSKPTLGQFLGTEVCMAGHCTKGGITKKKQDEELEVYHLLMYIYNPSSFK